MNKWGFILGLFVLKVIFKEDGLYSIYLLKYIVMMTPMQVVEVMYYSCNCFAYVDL